MHHPTAEPRPSLYYRYRVHKPWVPDTGCANAAPQRHRVVIAGSGPAGLVTALELARHGVPSVVVTPELQVSQGSRAIVFTRRSMEILQQVGVAERMTENGLPWRFGNSFYRGQKVFRLQAPHGDDDRFFPMLNLQQQYLEEYLLDACDANPLIELRWGNKVVDVSQDEAHARVEIDTPAGPYTLHTSWLVAADGGRSPIRSALKLSLEGASYEGLFVIADIRIDLPLPTERLAYFDPEWNPGNTILMHREPHGIWRVDYQLPPGETPEQALQPESLKARIDAQLQMIGFGGTPWAMDWSSVYSARTLTLPSYVHGRVLFVGDAAHLLPIFGVRGANTAFQDAQSLGWHLGLVEQGLAPATLLQNFSAERLGAAREIIDEAGKSTRFMAPPTRGFRLLRDAVLSLSLKHEFVRPLYHWRTSRPHAYTHSSLNAHDDDDALFAGGPARGAPPQNVRLGVNNHLLDHLGGGFDLLMFLGVATPGGPPAQATLRATLPGDVVHAVAAALARGLPVRITAIGPPQAVPEADQTLPDLDGHCHALWGAPATGAAYLLRPDQHICARWLHVAGHRLESALHRIAPGSPT